MYILSFSAPAIRTHLRSRPARKTSCLTCLRTKKLTYCQLACSFLWVIVK